ncbi:MAG: hypothetical protein ACK55I_18745, partial [bacterium]
VTDHRAEFATTRHDDLFERGIVHPLLSDDIAREERARRGSPWQRHEAKRVAKTVGDHTASLREDPIVNQARRRRLRINTQSIVKIDTATAGQSSCGRITRRNALIVTWRCG